MKNRYAFLYGLKYGDKRCNPCVTSNPITESGARDKSPMQSAVVGGDSLRSDLPKNLFDISRNMAAVALEANMLFRANTEPRGAATSSMPILMIHMHHRSSRSMQMSSSVCRVI